MNLYFSGRRLLSTRAERVGSFVEVEPILGRTRPLELTAAMGTWRSAAELDPGSLDQTTYFARRFGAPFDNPGEPEPAPFSTRDWAPLQAVLKQAAACYTDNSRWDDEGRSWGEQRSCLELFPDENNRRLAAITALDTFGPFTLTVPLGPNPLDFRVRSLADHLRMSARIFLGGALPMRRCDACNFWIGARHKAGRYCDGLCRNIAARRRSRKEAI